MPAFIHGRRLLSKQLEFMKKLLKEVDIKTIIILFLGWKLMNLLAYFFAFNFVKLNSTNFLGGGLKNYVNLPFIFSWANFDGEHYLSIAIIGYKGLEQAFFPVYPSLIRALAGPFGTNYTILVILGLLISNVAFLISLILLWKLVCLDFSKKVAFWTLLLMAVFPTSFYFGAMYNESLFLMLTLSVFLLVRSGNYFFASLMGFVSTATRIFGLLTLPALILDLIREKKVNVRTLWLFLIPGGLALYMLYQYLTVSDPIAFYRLQKLVGEQHQSGITLLPQVFYRYFKILSTVDFNNLIYQTMVLEVITALAFTLLPIYGFFKKMRWSYVAFALINFLMPTVQGSFSSVPRYVLVLFPSFLALAIFLEKYPKWYKVALVVLSVVWLFCENVLFLRGYWIA